DGSGAAGGGQNGSGGVRRPSVVPSSRSAQADTSASPAASPREQDVRSGSAAKQASAPAQPGKGGVARAAASQQAQGRRQTGKRGPRLATPESRSAQPRVQPQEERPRRASAQPRTPRTPRTPPGMKGK